MIIAIDGGAASGKSITAKLLSNKINFTHLNSGLIYRSFTYILLKNNLMNENDDFYKHYFTNIDYKIYGKNLNEILYKGLDISSELFNENITNNINIISNNYIIRNIINRIQRKIVENRNIVCEGRDIGTIVFPDAEFKFFLKADIKTRIDRRYDQFLKNNISISKKTIEEKLISRDYNDINRHASPLRIASDAMIIDNTNLSISNVIEFIRSKINIG